MNKKKLFVFLFPEEKYLIADKNPLAVSLFDKAIQMRYVKKGYAFAVAKHKGSPIYGISVVPDRIIETDETFQEACISKYTDFEKLAKQLNAEEYQQIIIGGYHFSDCVKKFAIQVYEINKNTIIDLDLTNLFSGRCLRFNQEGNEQEINPNFDFETYKPEEHFKTLTGYTQYCHSTLNLLETYHPVFGFTDLINKERKVLYEKEKNNPGF